MGEVISMLSGTGGMGKSALTAGMALTLAKSGKSVLCVDFQAGFGTLDIYLGMESQDALSYADICRGDYPLSQAAAHHAVPQLKFLAAPIRWHADEIADGRLQGLIRSAAASFDYVLLDAPAGLTEMARIAATEADRCILLCGIDPVSIRTAGYLADQLQLMRKTNVRLVVSRLQVDMLHTMKMTVDDIIDRVGIPLLGLVPEDGQVPLFIAAGKFPAGKKWAFAAYERIAKRMQGQPVPIPTR